MYCDENMAGVMAVSTTTIMFCGIPLSLYLNALGQSKLCTSVMALTVILTVLFLVSGLIIVSICNPEKFIIMYPEVLKWHVEAR